MSPPMALNPACGFNSRAFRANWRCPQAYKWKIAQFGMIWSISDDEAQTFVYPRFESIQWADTNMDDGVTQIEAKDLSYSNSFPSPKQHFVIRWVENLTGRITILKLVKRHQSEPPLPGNFWQQAMARMGINTDIGDEALAKIPKSGPLIIVANHPHGLVDGMVICEIMSRVRPDFQIMTRAFLAKVPDINDRMLPVAFDHEDDAIKKNVQARKDALNHVKNGGCLILFPKLLMPTGPTFYPAL